jgi:hypothetical protein
MTVGDAFTKLGNLLSVLESNDIEVVGVATDEVGTGESLGVELRLEIPTEGVDSGLSFERVVGARDGELGGPAVQGGPGTAAGGEGAAGTAAQSEPAEEEAAASGGESEPATSPASGATETDAAPTDTAGHACDRSDCDAQFKSTDALTVHRLIAHDQPDEPLHRHEPALEAAYRAYDSFPKMADALGVDVTPQTVRRNMIDEGIHDPDSPGTGVGAPAEQGRGDDGTETDDGTGMPGEEVAPEEDRAVTDGSGATADSGGGATADPDGGPTAGTEPAPASDDAADDTEDGDGTDAPPETVVEGITASALREAVVEGGSLRAAAERLDRGRGETRELLSEIGLLELVHGRVANRPELAERREAFEAWLADQREQPSGK